MFGQAGNAHYGTAKAGLVGLANTLALEGAKHGILANTVLPTGYSRMVSEQISGRTISAGQKAFYQAIDPDLVVPLVVYLASRNCSLTHHNVAACAGRYSRVFVGLSEGWLSPANTRPSAEDIASQITAIIDTDKFSIPGALYEEVAETCAMRGFDLAG
jgi:hypothetical protein